MKKIPDEAYNTEIKIDQNSVYSLCNSLNAMLHPVRAAGLGMAAYYMLCAEKTIFKLFEENQKLKKMFESKGSLNQ